MGHPFPLNIAPLHGDLDIGATQVQMASRSIRCFLQGSRSWQRTNRPIYRQTDHAIPSITIGRICIRSTTMQPKKYCWNYCQQQQYCDINTPSTTPRNVPFACTASLIRLVTCPSYHFRFCSANINSHNQLFRGTELVRGKPLQLGTTYHRRTLRKTEPQGRQRETTLANTWCMRLSMQPHHSMVLTCHHGPSPAVITPRHVLKCHKPAANSKTLDRERIN